MKEATLVTEAVKSLSPDERVCPICRHRRGQTYCKHFVGIMPPHGGRITHGDCDVPAFHEMPDSERLLYTESPNPDGITSFWMDYRPGIEKVTVAWHDGSDTESERVAHVINSGGKVDMDEEAPLTNFGTPEEILMEGIAKELRAATSGKVDMDEILPADDISSGDIIKPHERVLITKITEVMARYAFEEMKEDANSGGDR